MTEAAAPSSLARPPGPPSRGLRRIGRLLVQGDRPYMIYVAFAVLLDSYRHARRDVRRPGAGRLAAADRPRRLAPGEHALPRQPGRRRDRLRLGPQPAADHRTRPTGACSSASSAGTRDVTRWPDHLDETRFKRFARGYDDVMLISAGELRVIPWLMIEALIAEGRVPDRRHRVVRPHRRPAVPADGPAEGRLAPAERRPPDRRRRGVRLLGDKAADAIGGGTADTIRGFVVGRPASRDQGVLCPVLPRCPPP